MTSEIIACMSIVSFAHGVRGMTSVGQNFVARVGHEEGRVGTARPRRLPCAMFAIQLIVEQIRTGDIPDNFILFALGFLLVTVGQLLFARDLRPTSPSPCGTSFEGAAPISSQPTGRARQPRSSSCSASPAPGRGVSGHSNSKPAAHGRRKVNATKLTSIHAASDRRTQTECTSTDRLATDASGVLSGILVTEGH